MSDHHCAHSEQPEWYRLDASRLAEFLATPCSEGLSEEEAGLRLERFGPKTVIARGGIEVDASIADCR